MFEGRKYEHTGCGMRSIRFADQKKRAGVATTTYSYGMSDDEKTEMARRITAALNLTSHLSTAQIEKMAAEREQMQRTRSEPSVIAGSGD